jgi:hypothetical protein
MADINLAPSNYELEAIQKRRKLAELLMQQAQQPMEMPQMAGVRASPISGLAKLLQTYTASKNLKKSEAEEKEYQSDYLSDLGFLMRNAGKSTPATEAIPEQDGNPAVPAMKASPLLSPDLLSGNNANNYIKTNAGKMALAQLLMQQQAQEQARAQKLKDAELEVRAVAPGASLVQGGKQIYTNPAEPKLREVKTNNPLTGMPETRYYPENVLVAMGGIPDQYKGFAAELITAKNLPSNIKNDPQLLNLVGSQLNKQAGLVTEEDVAQYMLKVAETRAKLGYEGIPFAEPKGLTAASNPLIKPTLPKGVPLDAVPTGQLTPDGKPAFKTPDGKIYVGD